MYNKKSKASALLTIITAILIIGYMVMLPILLSSSEMEFGEVIAILLIGMVVGLLPLYASAIPFAIVGLIFGPKMLKQQSRQKLISLNTRMLITTCVLLPVMVWGVFSNIDLVSQSKMGVFPVIYVVVMALGYVAALVAQIVALVLLKKSPEESEKVEAVEPNATKQ